MEYDDLEMYCKMLTDKYVDLQKQLETAKREYEELKKINQQREDTIKLLKTINKELRKEIMQTPPYTQLLTERNRLRNTLERIRNDRDTLIAKLNSTINQNNVL